VHEQFTLFREQRKQKHNALSDTFVSYLCVRQGENLSPILFSIFLKYLRIYLFVYYCEGLQFLSDQVNEQLGNIYMMKCMYS
jgi:hypothetical protein